MLKNWRARRAQEAEIEVQSELVQAARTSRLGLHRYLTQDLEANRYLSPWEISDSHPWRDTFRRVRQVFNATPSASPELRAYFEIYVDQAIDVLWAAIGESYRGEATVHEELQAVMKAGMELEALDRQVKACPKPSETVVAQFTALTSQAEADVLARSAVL